ncbi:HTH domain-containing protein [Orbus wheelerorum]|uniref:HTH domain-containing protein n=1 Tax=Orbus wheelerorum TaxID=3074111 RepID=UPI00370DBC6B
MSHFLGSELTTKREDDERDNRHEQLAYRLSTILIRLFQGDSVSIKSLAEEFQVSERTISRDLRVRLGLLEINCHNKRYTLSKRQLGARLNVHDLVRFAKMMYIDRLFPALDNKLAAILTDHQHSPFIVYTYPPKTSVKPFSAFLLITEAILNKRKLTFSADSPLKWLPKNILATCSQIHLNTTSLTEASPFNPYRLVYVNQEWFLVGTQLEQLSVYRYEDMMNVTSLTQPFTLNDDLLSIIESEFFIQSLPHYTLLKALLHLKLT